MKRVLSAKEPAKSIPTNNVKRVCNYFGVSRPMNVDLVTRGYRVNAAVFSGHWVKDAQEAQEIVDDIYRALKISCTARMRSGYGKLAGTYDIIIPFADDNEPIQFEYSRVRKYKYSDC